ncbi:SCF ubiquitin ligase complex subunit [Mortierella polycephala]|uniref:SCF ubiquitin ligase complex subunit n=1 Tax=Mortierella polycephala TaxID=41804 RepID=A0A9P6Q5K5_9FUNG|nr:SCF ubiquitin ligase complex subunit [Mortierella polycephala]
MSWTLAIPIADTIQPHAVIPTSASASSTHSQSATATTVPQTSNALSVSKDKTKDLAEIYHYPYSTSDCQNNDDIDMGMCKGNVNSNDNDCTSDSVNELSIRSVPSSPSPPSSHQVQHREQPEEQQGQAEEHPQRQQDMSTRKQYPIIPSELIFHIFKFLTVPQDLRSATLVCKLWCSCGVELLWSRPALSSMTLVHKLSQTMVLDPRTETIFPYPDYIRRLNFSFVAKELTDEVLARFQCCNRLERLLLPRAIKTTAEGLKQILEVGHGLHSLDLSDIPAVTDDVLKHVARYCPKLHTLYLAECFDLTDEAIVKLATSCPSLKRIGLKNCVLLTDRSILALTQHCRQLMEMDLTRCNLITNTAIQSVFQKLPHIRDINMTLLPNLTDQAFAFIPFAGTTTSASLPAVRYDQLRVLNLSLCDHITDEALARIIPAAPRLRNLVLTKCDRITDVGVCVIKVLGKHLHHLHLGHCSKLTDRAIITLAQHCTRIRYLDLACCSKLTDAAVFALAQLPKLRRIGLVKCSNITDHGIYALLVSQVVPQTLERVHLSYCVNLSDTAVAALVEQCARLTHLSVTGVPAFMSPRYQQFCRVSPTEFTARQREVFCVFSGKGVRELRQFMRENPTMTASTISSIQGSYRIMGSTVASMVAGGPHSSAILAHLGLTLRESEAHGQNLAAAAESSNVVSNGTGDGLGSSASGSSDVSEVSSAVALPVSVQSLVTDISPSQLFQQEVQEEGTLGVLTMEQQMEEPEQVELRDAEEDYIMPHGDRNYQPHHPHLHVYKASQHLYNNDEVAKGQGSSSSSTSLSPSSTPPLLLSTSSEANSPDTPCPFFQSGRSPHPAAATTALGLLQDHGTPLKRDAIHTQDVRMVTPDPVEREQGQGDSEDGQGCSGGGGHGILTEYEEVNE